MRSSFIPRNKALFSVSLLLRQRSHVSSLPKPPPMSSNLLKPPEHVAGLTTLTKQLFEKTVKLPRLKLTNVTISTVLPFLKKSLLKLENFKPVQTVSDEIHIYLNPETVERWEDLSPEFRSLDVDSTSLETCPYTLTYDNFSLESVLRAVLPQDVEGVSSFTKVGHIVHVNLREHLLAYKDLIGEVLYEKVPNCRTVVNKTSMIDNTYRNFNMEVLRGDDDMLTSVKENKCVFDFDFSKVYWNSRLCTEHERIVTMINPGDVVFDVFAGVGPFSIPLAKRKCQVYANDLNPESFKWLSHNAKKNKVDSKFFQAFNQDGGEFIGGDVKSLLPQYLGRKVYILMNLPALAAEFLSSFVGLYDDGELTELPNPPTVLLYCFAKGENCEEIARRLIHQKLGGGVKILEVFKVRTVSSLKEMMRVTFKLDREILIKKKRKNETDETGEKKTRHGEEQEED